MAKKSVKKAMPENDKNPDLVDRKQFLLNHRRNLNYLVQRRALARSNPGTLHPAYDRKLTERINDLKKLIAELEAL